MQYLKKRQVFLTAIFLMSYSAFGLTLEEVFQKSISFYPEIKINQISKDVAGLSLKKSYSEFYPSAAINADVTKTYSSAYDSSGKDAVISLNYTLYSGGSRDADVNYSKLSLNIADKNYSNSLKKLKKEVSAAYAETLSKKKLMFSQKEIVDSAKKTYEMSKAIYEAGRMKHVDMIKSLVDLQNAESKYVEYKNAVRDSLNKLSLYSGDLYNIETEIEEVKPLPLLLSVDDYIKSSLSNNYDIAKAEIQILQAAENIKKSKSEIYPTVKLFANGGWYKNNGVSDSEYRSASVGANLSWQIFDGFKRENDIAVKKKEYYSTLEEKRKYTNEITYQIREAYNAVISAEEKLKYLLEMKRYSKESYALTEESFKIGKSNILDLLKAKDQYESASADLITTQNNLLVNKIILNYISGMDWEL